MTSSTLKYIIVFATYLTTDMGYQFAIGMQWAAKLQKKAGIKYMFADSVQHPWMMGLWFIIMTIAIIHFAINPALEQKNKSIAIKNAFLLGLLAYGTLALANGWSIKSYPSGLVFEIMLEGMLFPTITAAVATSIFMRQTS